MSPLTHLSPQRGDTAHFLPSDNASSGRPPVDPLQRVPSFSFPVSSTSKTHPVVSFTKDHQIVPLSSDSVLREIGPLFSQFAITRIALKVTQCFTPEHLSGLRNLFSMPQNFSTWIALHNEIALQYTGKSLFENQEFPDVDSDMTLDEFSGHAQHFFQDPTIMISMIEFFQYLSSETALEKSN